MSENEQSVVNELPAEIPAAENNLNDVKVLKQHEIKAIVDGAKRQAHKKGYEEGLAQAQLSQAPSPPPSIGGIPQLSQEKIQSMIADEAQKQVQTWAQTQAQQAQAQQVVNSFKAKMEQGKSDYPDFEQKVSKLGNLASIAPIVQLAAGVDNTHDVMYDLADNPQKMTHLLMLSNVNPQLAQDEMHKLAVSIKTNRDAASRQLPNNPLNQLKPSINPGGGSTDTSISNFKRKYRA